jgi:hypothetical protein
MLLTAPTGNQTATKQDVDRLLADTRAGATKENPRILARFQRAQMLAKNNGYPKDMYHPVLDMRQAMNEKEEEALATLGYSDRYIAKAYPKVLFRRNMDPRFEPKFDRATGLQVNMDYVEERSVKTLEEEKALRALPPTRGASPWFDRVVDLPPIDEGPTEDPSVTQARMEGEIEALRAQLQAATENLSRPARAKRSDREA